MLSYKEEQTKLRGLNCWFLSTHGSAILHAFEEELLQIVDFLKGEILLQLGDVGSTSWLSTLHYKHKWICTPYFDTKNSINSTFNAIALDKDSVDCVMVPLLVYPFAEDDFLNEIDRILKPMGYVIFFGINPLSLWGIGLRLGYLDGLRGLGIRPASVFAIKQAMLRRDYVQCHLTSFYFIPPVKSARAIGYLKFLNEVGKMMQPCPAGFYCLVMQKIIVGHTDLLLEPVVASMLTKKSVLLQGGCQFKG